jgi:hypothetical protein
MVPTLRNFTLVNPQVGLGFTPGPRSASMRIVILFDWRMKYLLCFIGPKDFHPNFNWMVIHSQILIGP